jgi:hypothetical protein
MIRKYAIQNIRRISEWIDSGTLEFKTPKLRLTKKNRKRLNEAVATLKGFGMLKPKQVERTNYQTVTVDLDKIQNFIMQQHGELVSRFGLKDCVIIMGSPEFHALTNSMIPHPMFFPLSNFQVGHLQNRFMGIGVVILPWMSGTVFVPKEYLPIDRELIPSGVMVTAETQQKLERERDGKLAAELWRRTMHPEELED